MWPDGGHIALGRPYYTHQYGELLSRSREQLILFAMMLVGFLSIESPLLEEHQPQSSPIFVDLMLEE
jgi:hypothetical protein